MLSEAERKLQKSFPFVEIATDESINLKTLRFLSFSKIRSYHYLGSGRDVCTIGFSKYENLSGLEFFFIFHEDI